MHDHRRKQQFSSLGENLDDKHGAQLFTQLQGVPWADLVRSIDSDKLDGRQTFG